MYHTHARFIRTTIATFALALGLTGTALAQTDTPATGLGQSWPNAADLAINPNWHVYVFERNGIKYIQVNDRNGTVHAAVGTTGDATFALPVGTDAEHVDVSSSAASVDANQTVYRDDSMTVMAAPQSDGTVQVRAVNMATSCPYCETGGRIMN